MAKKASNRRNSKSSNIQGQKIKDKSQLDPERKKNSETLFEKRRDNFRIEKLRYILIALLAIIFGFFNSYHQSTMFENDRHFSHLSSLEREMTFRTEMGLYYFYYKVITEAPSLWSGLNRIMNDNLTEYPSIINTLERFNLYPEVVIAASYRNLKSFADYYNIKLQECWQVLRGNDLPPIESCEGIGDPAYFYVTFVFLFNSLVGSLMFLYGTILSNSITGGLLSAACFFFNHGECTRVQWTPPLRESFGYPLFLLQMMLVTLILRNQKVSFSHSFIIAVVTSFFMLSWQFAQFVLLVQILALFAIYIFDMVSPIILKCILKGHIINLIVSIVFLFGNKMLIASLYTSTLIVLILVIQLEKFNSSYNSLLIKVVQIVCFIIGCIIVKFLLSYILNIKDDAHVWNILKAKFTSYKDFHTMLYTCAVEFDFLAKEAYIMLSKTLVLPLGMLSALVILFIILHKRYTNVKENYSNSEVLYNILQHFAFFIMAAIIMRLKVFFTPHLSLMVSLTMSSKFFPFLNRKEIRYCIFVAFLSAMSVQGIQNIQHQRNILGEYNNPEFEELILWVNSTLPEEAVFAGTMSTMANVLLSTRRPIIIHPHYENADLRERTHKVYEIFSRKKPSEVYDTLNEMKANYIIIDRVWCYGKMREGCGMIDLWDMEDEENRNGESLCHKLVQNPSPFHKVFQNGLYAILALGNISSEKH